MIDIIAFIYMITTAFLASVLIFIFFLKIMIVNIDRSEILHALSLTIWGIILVIIIGFFVFFGGVYFKILP